MHEKVKENEAYVCEPKIRTVTHAFTKQAKATHFDLYK